MNTKYLRRRQPSTILLALGASLAIAACGSSSGGGTKTSTTASTSSGRAKLVTCLKQHGVTLPARGARSGSGGGFFGGGGQPPGGTGTTGTPTVPSGAPPSGGAFPGGSNSKFRAAIKACGGNLGRFRPGSGAGAPGARFSSATLDKFVTCVRKHGYNLPKPNTSGGPIFPRSIQSNKKFQAASKSCASLLRPSVPATGISTTTTS